MQLSLFKRSSQHTTPTSFYTFNFNTPNPKQAAKLRELAASMQQSINSKLNPAINKQRATKRRKTIAQGIIAEGVELQTIQSWLLAIAEMWFFGNIPEVLRGISQKSQVEALYKISQVAKTLEEVNSHLAPIKIEVKFTHSTNPKVLILPRKAKKNTVALLRCF